MGILLTTIAGLALWIILWAIDVKSFDAFLITVLMVVSRIPMRSRILAEGLGEPVPRLKIVAALRDLRRGE
jgi:hypothetical protein